MTGSELRRLPYLALALALIALTLLVGRADAREWTVPEIIADRAAAHGVSAPLMVCIAQLESRLDPLAVGDHGQSYGLFQLYRWGGMYPRFWAQGYSDLWSAWDQADFAARAVADGYGPHWTAWRYCR